MLLSTFVGKSSTSDGSAASVLALGVGLLFAQVFFYGAETTRIFASDYGGRIVPHTFCAQVSLARP